MAERRDDARGRDVTRIIMIIVALLVGYAWGRPSIQTGAAPTIQRVSLTPEQDAELRRLTDELERLRAQAPPLTPEQEDVVDDAEDFTDSVTTTVVAPPPVPTPPTTEGTAAAPIHPVAPTPRPTEREPLDWEEPPATTTTGTVP